MAELWGSVVVSLLFWGFANQVGTPPLHGLSLMQQKLAVNDALALGVRAWASSRNNKEHLLVQDIDQSPVHS